MKRENVFERKKATNWNMANHPLHTLFGAIFADQLVLKDFELES